MKPVFLKTVEPYQVLFSIGLLHGILGGMKWILFLLNYLPYPGLSHAHSMFTGFLLSFATGFLLTAVPRFTGAPRCSLPELFIATVISITSLVYSNPVMTLLMLLFLSTFFLRRIYQRKHNPPAHFIFIPVGLLLGLTGATISALVHYSLVDASYYSIARILLFHGTMLSFLLGIGARLISALLGWAPLPNHISTGQKPAILQRVPVLQCLVFVSGFLLEIFSFTSTGRGLRAICATWIGIQNWKILRLPKNNSKFSFWIWISAIFLILGLWVYALVPKLEVHAAHLIFVGGFGCLTFMVASRVTLAHGSHSLQAENDSRIYAFFTVLILGAALTRFSAIWTPSYFRHLAYAGGVWILAILAWSYFFLPKVFSRDIEIG